MSLTISINSQKYNFQEGETVLEIARRNAIHIPTLCHLAGASPTGACRICLVEVEGVKNLNTACATPATDKMEVLTDSEKVTAARKTIVSLMLASGDHNCLLCPQNGDCELQNLAYHYQVDGTEFPSTQSPHPQETSNPFIIRDFSRCVLCGKCVQACNDIQVNQVLNFGFRGSQNKIIAGMDTSLINSECVFCGECLQACPVGALVDKKSVGKARNWETHKVRTTCPYCGVGCQLWLHVKNDKVLRVTGVEDGLPNKGRLCAKGRFGYDFIYSEKRLTTPLIRRDGRFEEASWDEALDLISEKFRVVLSESGPDAVSGISCSRGTNEDNYQMQKLFRAVFKTNNIDQCART